MSGRLHHVSITCVSLTASIAFYHKFGFTIEQEFQDKLCTIVLLENRNTHIELFTFADAVSPQDHEDLIYLKAIGIRHLAIEVDDLIKIHQALSTTTTVTPIKQARLGSFNYFFCYDPDGNQIEIIKTNQYIKGIK
ncbi:Lactoylglutathione lyase [Moritella viscosa]|uniref:VOC family protein n=1 Tax=Moritella viscosa TaxID=80854 RepID=UPI00091AC320|nr:VOC family protein [Moritella viscosa]SGZ08328.1 Lactoylglutathione lyase [Moritella viscosa]